MSRGLELLRKALSNDSTRRKVDLGAGDYMEFWMRPLVLKDRIRAKAMMPTKDKEDLALQGLALVILKATDEDGRRLFDNGDYLELKDRLPESVLLAFVDETFKNAFEEEMSETEAGETPEQKAKKSTTTSRKTTT